MKQLHPLLFVCGICLLSAVSLAQEESGGGSSKNALNSAPAAQTPATQTTAAQTTAAQSSDDEPDAPPSYAKPQCTATVIGPNPGYVGQMIQIELELLRDNQEPDKQAPFFPEIEIPDAIALLSSTAPPPETREVKDTTYLVQKRRYLIFPQVEGTLKVPSIAVVIPLAKGKFQEVRTKAVEVVASIPRGSQKRMPLIAGDVRLERNIDGKLDDLQVGDAFTVSLKLTATDTDPVMLPQLQLAEIAGLSRYPGQPSTHSQSDRGQYVASRVDQATYVANEWGFYHLPEVSVFWLDPQSGNYAEATVPALKFRARVNPRLGKGCVGGPMAATRLGGSLGLIVLAALASVRWWRRRTKKRAALSRVPKSKEEAFAFHELKKAAHAEDDKATLTALYRWLRYALPQASTLEELRKAAQLQDLNTSTRALEERVSQGKGEGKASDVLPPLSTLRKSHKRITETELPDLN